MHAWVIPSHTLQAVGWVPWFTEYGPTNNGSITPVSRPYTWCTKWLPDRLATYRTNNPAGYWKVQIGQPLRLNGAIYCNIYFQMFRKSETLSKNLMAHYYLWWLGDISKTFDSLGLNTQAEILIFFIYVIIHKVKMFQCGSHLLTSTNNCV